MKPVGVIRRLDDLGRVVFPKEFRKMLNLKDGDPVEIHCGTEGILIKKYVVSEEELKNNLGAVINSVEYSYFSDEQKQIISTMLEEVRLFIESANSKKVEDL